MTLSDPVDRLMAQVDKRPDGCWQFRGTPARRYGRLMVNGVRVDAHRFAYEHFIGPIPPGSFVCHRCDNPRCVNPEHLFAGSPLDNMRDKIEKGRLRVPLGSEHGMSKLTDAEVDAIRRRYAAHEANQYELAAEYGVSQAMVSNIVRGKHWKHR